MPPCGPPLEDCTGAAPADGSGLNHKTFNRGVFVIDLSFDRFKSKDVMDVPTYPKNWMAISTLGRKNQVKTSQRPSWPYGLDFTAIGGKRQGREVPQPLRVEPGAKHPVWKTRSQHEWKKLNYPMTVNVFYFFCRYKFY
jgi:hypothetical protein